MQVAFIEAIGAIGRDKLLSASDVADCLLPNVLANISHAPASPEVSTTSLQQHAAVADLGRICS